MAGYAHLRLVELDDLVARGEISFDDYWDARIAIDAREQVAADVNQYDLPQPDSAGRPDTGSPPGLLPDAAATEAPGGPDWIGPPPRPAVRTGPEPSAAPMVPPPPPRTAEASGPVQLDFVGPSAEAATTRPDDRARSRRRRSARRDRDAGP